MTRRSIAVALTALCVASACRRVTPKPGLGGGGAGGTAFDSACWGAQSPPEFYRLQKRVDDGEQVCLELASPRIEIGRELIAVNGQAFTWTPPAAFERVDVLFHKLRRGRDLFRSLYPGKDFRPIVTVTHEPGISAFAGASVLQTAALAGYPTLDVRSGDTTFAFEWWFPPPRGERASPTEVLRLTPTSHNLARFRFEGIETPRLGFTLTLDTKTLPIIIETECMATPNACIDRIVVEVGETDFASAVSIAASVAKAPPLARRRMPAVFAPPAVPAPSALKTPVWFGKLRLGATLVSGVIRPELVQEVIGEDPNRFLVCYDRALEKNPALQGRVSARFVIGRDGVSSNAMKASADLPDETVVSCVVGAFDGVQFPQLPSVVRVTTSVWLEPKPKN